MSKLPLLSYNQSRITIFLNTLSYCMDIYFSVLLSIFMAALILQKIFTSTEPHQIGKKSVFHQELYKYCCKSTDESEFELKLVIINYICVRSYFQRLKQEDDMEYYAFAANLYSKNESELKRIKLKSFRHFHNEWSFKRWMISKTLIPISEALKFKSIQCLIRGICLTLGGLLDLFWLGTFQTDSAFMNLYGDIVTPFCWIGVVVFLLWISFVIYQLVVSKWIKFCYYMHASKHQQFVLLVKVEEFKEECEKILKQNLTSKTSTTKHNDTTISTTEIICETVMIHTRKYVERLQKQEWSDGDNSKHLWCSVMLQLAIIAVLNIEPNSKLLPRKVMMIYSIVIICILNGFLIILFKKQYATYWKNLCYIGVPFTIFCSEIPIFIYLCYFYETQSSIVNTAWIAVGLLIFIGFIMSFFKQINYVVFILKDIVIISINEVYSFTGEMINGKLHIANMSFNASEWLLFGTAIHFIWLWKKDSSGCLKYSSWCLFFICILVGFVLWNEIKSNGSVNTECANTVLLWCILQTIEFVIVLCALISRKFQLII
eukprot:509522_1